MTPRREAATPEQSSWTSRVEARGEHQVLHLSGTFHAGWAGRLAAGLAARRVGVVSGVAQRSRTNVWTAELELEVLDPKVDPAAIDCFELIGDRDPPATPPGDLVLASYRLTPRAGSLEVELRAPDAVGQLDRALRTFAFFGLFPCAMRLARGGAVVEGVFQLQALGQTEPGLQVIDGLDRRLSSLVAGGESNRPGPAPGPVRTTRRHRA